MTGAGALTCGATVVPIYQTNSPEECRYVLENSDAKVVVVEDDDPEDITDGRLAQITALLSFRARN